MTTPAIRTFYQKTPHSEIHLLTQTPSHQIFSCNPYVSKVYKAPLKPGLRDVIALIRQLRNQNYTSSIDFSGLPNAALLSRLVGARKRVGFRQKGRSLFYTHPIDIPKGMDYSAQHKLHLLSAFGITADDTKLDFFITDEDRLAAQKILRHIGATDKRPLISISPVSRRDYKVWPAPCFAEICDYLAERYHAQILFLWGPGEYHFVKNIKDRMKRSALPNYDIPSIAETVGLLEKVDLHVGNDNGPMHFAIAAGAPTVAIFGKPQLKNWTPPQNPRHLAVEFDPGCKTRCVYPKCHLECLTQLTPDTVRQKIDQHLA